MKRSFYMSTDQNHAQHPNYAWIQQENHTPRVNEGILLCQHVDQKFTSDGEGSAIVTELCVDANVPLQEMIVKQGTPCGSTIGPTIAAVLGMKTCDVGLGQWAMHSIREMQGVVDVHWYKLFMIEFWSNFVRIRGQLLQT